MSMHNQKGNLIAISVIIIVAVSAFGVAILKLLTTESRSHDQFLQAKQSFYLAESGMEFGLLEIQNNIDVNNPSTYCDGNFKTTQSYGNGEFRFKCTVYNASTTTTTAEITDTDLIIPVNSLTNLAPMGRVIIDSAGDREDIDYSGTSTDASICGTAPCLIVKKRAVNGTTADDHDSGDSITQNNQVVVTAVGAVPSISSPTAEKEVQRAIILDTSPSGWAVGAGGIIYKRTGLGFWTEVTLSPTTSRDFFAVACVDENDCWAVGANATTYRWNGSSWTQFTSGTLSDDLLSVACPASNDCWISNNNNDIFRWNGTSWSLNTTFSELINSIACTSTTNCIAVGEAGEIQQWNGSSWSAMTSPIGEDLNSVSCPTSSLCYAVGGGGVIIKLSGGTWTSETSPTGEPLLSVSCPSTTFCWTVTEDRTETATYDGISWSLATIGGPDEALSDISCVSSSDCIVVGPPISGTIAGVRSWNGTSWSTDTVTLLSGEAGELNAVIRFDPVNPENSIANIAWRQVFN